jgi:hypothetical protein
MYCMLHSSVRRAHVSLPAATHLRIRRAGQQLLVVRLAAAGVGHGVEVAPLGHALVALLLADLDLRLLAAAAQLVALELALVLVRVLPARHVAQSGHAGRARVGGLRWRRAGERASGAAREGQAGASESTRRRWWKSGTSAAD